MMCGHKEIQQPCVRKWHFKTSDKSIKNNVKMRDDFIKEVHVGSTIEVDIRYQNNIIDNVYYVISVNFNSPRVG